MLCSLPEYLKDNQEKYFLASDLFNKVKKSMVYYDQQTKEPTTPQYGPVPLSIDDRGGEFIFIRKSGK